jgi:PAS domain S-box-containing protein
MKHLARIQELLQDLPPGSLSDEQRATLLQEIARATAEHSHLKQKYDRTFSEKAMVHSLLQRSSEELIQRYQALFEHSGVPMVILNEQGMIVLANSHFFGFSGLTRQEVTRGLAFADLIDENDRTIVEEYHHARRKDEDVPFQYEIRFKPRDSGYRDVSLSIELLPGGTESVVSFHDITVTKKQRAELTTHNERLQAMLSLYQMTEVMESDITAYAIRKSVALTSSRFGFITFIENEGEMAVLEAFWSEHAENWETDPIPRLKQMTVPVSDVQYLKQVVVTGEILNLTSSPAADRVLKNIVENPIRFQRALFIPITDQDRVVAVACVADKPEPYDTSDQIQLTVLMTGMWRLIIRNRQEDALKTANKKLSLLSSLTRHDVLNLLTALEGYLDLSREITDEPELLLYLKKGDSAIQSIKEIIAFTKEYELVGMTAPVWQNVSRTFENAVELSSPHDIMISSLVEGVWIYADPLLIRVFSNFIDNSIRHGYNVSSISLSSVSTSDELTLVYEDDGVGVEWGEKEKIFARGYGKHTGLGLFLIREIFAITGIRILESGDPGTGVKFEMHIPRGNFRVLSGDEMKPEGKR